MRNQLAEVLCAKGIEDEPVSKGDLCIAERMNCEEGRLGSIDND